MKILDGNCLDPQLRREAMSLAFEERYKSAPAHGVRAPGRVDLMGSHTDYNEGCVLTLPIDRETWLVASPRPDSMVHAVSLNLGTEISFDLGQLNREPEYEWGRYLHGVAAVLCEAGYGVRGFNAVVHGTVPLSSGLSSSASLEAATATLFEQLGNYRIDPVEKARLTQRAENEWVGVNCGILDQYSSILGERSKALMLDCRSLTHSYAAFPSGLRVVICNTCAPRQLSGSEYGARREQCEKGASFFASRHPEIRTLRDVSQEVLAEGEAELSEVVEKRSRFIVEENARVGELAGALRRDDRQEIGDLMTSSFHGARDLFEISVPAMQVMFDAMGAAPGCVGCRQAGAGFGGCMLSIVEKAAVGDFCLDTAEVYQKRIGIVPQIYPIRTADGAGML